MSFYLNFLLPYWIEAHAKKVSLKDKTFSNKFGLITIFFKSKLNTQYMANSTLVSPVKMKYGWSFSISGLKMMMKSGLEKIFLKFLHALPMLFLLLNLYFWSKFSNKYDNVSAWRNFKIIFPRPLFIIIFSSEMLKFHPYSILTGDTRVEFATYCVLSKLQKRLRYTFLNYFCIIHEINPTVLQGLFLK